MFKFTFLQDKSWLDFIYKSSHLKSNSKKELHGCLLFCKFFLNRDHIQLYILIKLNICTYVFA